MAIHSIIKVWCDNLLFFMCVMPTTIIELFNFPHIKFRTQVWGQSSLCMVRNTGLLKIFWLGLPVLPSLTHILWDCGYRKGTCLAEQEGVDFLFSHLSDIMGVARPWNHLTIQRELRPRSSLWQDFRSLVFYTCFRKSAIQQWVKLPKIIVGCRSF